MVILRDQLDQLLANAQREHHAALARHRTAKEELSEAEKMIEQAAGAVGALQVVIQVAEQEGARLAEEAAKAKTEEKATKAKAPGPKK